MIGHLSDDTRNQQTQQCHLHDSVVRTNLPDQRSVSSHIPTNILPILCTYSFISCFYGTSIVSVYISSSAGLKGEVMASVCSHDSPTQRKNSSKNVRFSKFSTMKQMHYHFTPKEKAEIWYSKQEEEAFKSQRWQDAAKYSAVLMHGCDDKDTFINCLGLDNLLSQDVYQKSLEVSRAQYAHTARVLSVQELQRRHRINVPEDLARISMHSSRVSNERAQKVAALWNLYNS